MRNQFLVFAGTLIVFSAVSVIVGLVIGGVLGTVGLTTGLALFIVGVSLTLLIVIRSRNETGI